MNSSPRARADASEAWDRARRAYVELLGEGDPAASYLAAGAVDRRLGPAAPAAPGALTLVSGPDDLMELREVVESALGVGTWPTSEAVDGQPVRGQVTLDRASDALRLLLAMEGLIEVRSPWGKWRTAVDTLADRIRSLTVLTIDGRVLGDPD